MSLCIIDDLWVRSFCLLNVHDMCSVRETSKQFFQITDPDYKVMRNYWKYQSILIGCNQNYSDQISTDMIANIDCFCPLNNDWYEFYVEWYKALSACGFIDTASIVFSSDLANQMSLNIDTNINTLSSDDGLTVLGHCCAHNYFQVVRYLLLWNNCVTFNVKQQRDCKNQRNENDHANSQSKLKLELELELELQSSEAESGSKVKSKLTPLEFIVNKQPEYGSDEFEPISALHLATKYKYYTIVDLLLRCEESKHHCGANEWIQCCKTEDINIIQMYLNPHHNVALRMGNMELNGFDSNGDTPLHHSCDEAGININLVEILLDTIASNKFEKWDKITPININAINRQGRTALMKAINSFSFFQFGSENLRLDTVKLFLDMDGKFKDKIDLFIVDSQKYSIFTLAVSNGLFDVAVHIFSYFTKYYHCSPSYRVWDVATLFNQFFVGNKHQYQSDIYNNDNHGLAMKQLLRHVEMWKNATLSYLNIATPLAQSNCR